MGPIWRWGTIPDASGASGISLCGCQGTSPGDADGECWDLEDIKRGDEQPSPRCSSGQRIRLAAKRTEDPSSLTRLTTQLPIQATSIGCHDISLLLGMVRPTNTPPSHR